MTTKPAYKRSRPNTLSFVNRTIGCLILSFFLMANASSLVYARKVVVKVGVYDNPPILYKTEAGKYKGLAIEILEYIASEEGWDIEYVSGTWSECLKKLENGEIDIQAYIAYSAKRAKKYSYTNETLFSNWGQVFKQPGSNIESILDLNQKTVVLLKNAIHNTAFRELIRKLPIECKIIEVDSNDLVLRFVGEMKADAGVVNRVFGDTQAKKYSIEKTSIIFDPIEIRYATPKGKKHHLTAAIDKHISALKKDEGSIFYLLLSKTFGTAIKPVVPRWVKWSMLTGIGLILIVLFASIILRYQVKLKTAELVKKNIQLEKVITERKLTGKQLQTSLEEKEILLREIHHRVKNNMQVITSMLRLQSAKGKRKQYDDLLKESQNRIKSMALIHEKLYQSKDLSRIDFGEYVKALMGSLYRSHGVGTDKIALRLEMGDVSLGLDNSIPCGLIINELVSNSLKYAFPRGKKGEIRVALQPNNEDEVELTVSDNGIGLAKDLDFRSTESLGLELVTVLVEHQLGGRIELDREGGTTFRIRFQENI